MLRWIGRLWPQLRVTNSDYWAAEFLHQDAYARLVHVLRQAVVFTVSFIRRQEMSTLRPLDPLDTLTDLMPLGPPLSPRPHRDCWERAA